MIFLLLEKKSRSLMQRFGFLEVAMRQNDLAFEVRDYLRAHPNAAVVNLGCGLDATGRSCGNGSCKLYNLVSRMSSVCAMSCCPPGRGRRTSRAT